MTRASTEQAKYVPWFAKAGAACSIVPIARFVSDHIFALKGGGYGCLFALSGVDEEGLTDQELESQLRMIEGALAWAAGRRLSLPVRARSLWVRSTPSAELQQSGYARVCT